MIPLLAQAGDFSPAALKDWIAILFYLVGGVTACLVLWKMVSGKNGTTEIGGQPLTVRAADDYATIEQHAALARKMDEELGRERGARKKMHEEIADLQGDVKSLRAETAHQSETLGELKADGKTTGTKVDTLIGEQRGLVQQVHQIVVALQNRK